MTIRQTTECQGQWRNRYVAIPEYDGDDFALMRCDGCGDQMVILGYRGYPERGAYPPDMDPEDAIRLALTERALRKR